MWYQTQSHNSRTVSTLAPVKVTNALRAVYLEDLRLGG